LTPPRIAGSCRRGLDSEDPLDGGGNAWWRAWCCLMLGGWSKWGR
jgi:hypothetical protein